MPVALLLALAASLGLHAAALFGPQLELSLENEPAPILAELRPMPRPPPEVVAEPLSSAPQVKQKRVERRERKVTPPLPSPSPVAPVETTVQPEIPEIPAGVAEAASTASTALLGAEAEAPPAEPALPSVSKPPRIPERGVVLYRVDRGDNAFEIGSARHAWHIAEGAYRIESLLETTGLVGLFKPVRIVMASRGQMTASGLRPDEFSVHRNGVLREQARFDWAQMTVSIGQREVVPLHEGAQDLLSFHYQLGYLPDLHTGSSLAVATGKKYGAYRLEVIGDEEIELPVGRMRTLHLRAPGVNTTKLWLAYDYLMLPVKIRHLDSQGDSLVQVATEIQMSPE